MLTRLVSRETPRGSESGFTIIEVTFTTMILIIVLALFLNALVSLTKSEDRSQRLVSNEQNVRFELDQLAREIRASNPLVPLLTATSAADYDNQIEIVLGPQAGPQTVVRWTYDTVKEEMVRQVMSDTSATATVVSQSFFLNRVRNVETGTPVFTYYGQHGEDLVAQTIADDGGTIRTRCTSGELRDPRAHRAVVRLEPGAAAVHRDTRRGSPQPASRKCGVRVMPIFVRKRDERGNMIVVMGVIMVLTLLMAVVTARTLSGLQSTRQGQDFSAALANADAGVSDALFRIDQLGNAPAATFCVGANVGVHALERARRSGRAVHGPARRRQHVHRAVEGPRERSTPRDRSDRHALVSRIRSRSSPRRRSPSTATPATTTPSTGIGPVETVDASGNVVTSPRPTSRATARSRATAPCRPRTSRTTSRAAARTATTATCSPAPTTR